MRRGAVLAWVVLLALCLWRIAGTHFVADLSSFLPVTPTAAQRLLVEELREGAVSRLMLVGIEGGDPASRARVSRSLAAALASSGQFASVANGAGGGFERELLFSHRYALSANVTPQRFTVEGLRASIGETLDLLASSAGLAVKPLVARDPTGETLAIAESLRPAQGPATSDGVWISPDGRRALLLARTRAAGSDTDAQAAALDALGKAFDAAVEREKAQGVRFVVTGPGVLSVRARALIKHDVERLAAASLLVVAALLLFVYRSPMALGLGLLPVVSGAIAGIAAVSLGFGAVHGITLGFGTTLIGEAVDYSIYLFVQAERAGRAEDPAWLAGFWPTIRLGVLTSIAGFAALLFSGVQGLAQLGLYSITGLAAAALVTRFVLPSLMPAGFRIRDVAPLGARLRSAAAAVPFGRAIVAVIALASVAVIVAHRDTLWDPRIESLNPISRQDRELDAQLRGALGASDARQVIAIPAQDLEAALEAAEKIGRELDALAARNAIAGYDSPARFLPSAATQRARLASLPEAATLRARLRDALAGMPLRAQRLEPFVADVEQARTQAPLARDEVARTALGQALDGLLYKSANGWTALIGLRLPAGASPDPAPIREAVARAGVKEAALLDVRGELDRMYEGYFDRALAMSIVGVVAIAILLAIALRSPRRVLRVMAPLAAGVLFVAACHALGATRMSLLHLVGLLLVVAIGSNYTLFFDSMRHSAGATERTLASLALANLTTVASFGILSMSRIPVLNAMGSTVALGALATLVFAALASPVESPRAHDHP